MTAPSVPEGKTALASPPQRTDAQGAASWVMLLLPLLSSMSMAAYMVAYGRAWMILLGVAFVVTSIGITIAVRMQLRSSRRKKEGRQRERYEEYLADVRKQASRVAVAQRIAGMWRHPDPERLWVLATRRRRVWERRPEDKDFLHLRVGTGTAPLATPLSLAQQSDPTVELDPPSRRAAEEVVETLGSVTNQPAWVDLGGCGVVSVIGPREGTEKVAQSMLAQLGVLHAPDDVRVAVITGDATGLEWAKWLPHAEEPGAEPQRREQEAVPLLAADFHGLQDHLQAALDKAVAERSERSSKFTSIRSDDKPRQQFVVFVNGFDPAAWWARSPLVADLLNEAGPKLGLHLVCLVEEEAKEPGRVDVRVRVDAQGGLSLEGPAGRCSEIADATVDECRREILEDTARALTPLRLSGEREQVLSEDVSLSGMLGFRDLAGLDPATNRKGPDDKELLRTPIGVEGTGEAVTLDLKESAQGGIGPHGLIVGATGSGKSELLRTLVTGLALTHTPDHLAFVLVDFKGGATFAEVTELPHVSGLITNLADDLALVDRMRQALQGEQQRRQRMLREAGNVDSVREYQLRQAAGGTDIHGKPLEPLPYLLVIVDEFGELLSQRPDFIDLFVQIGRVGRSLGIHLLLATQRLEEGRLRGLESHLSYRICLRTFSAGESRAVIGTSDAYMLPSIPGSAYLKVDESVYERFRVAHVSAPYRAEEPEDGRGEPPAPVPYLVRGDLPPLDETESSETVTWEVTGEASGTELQAIVGRLVDEDAPGHQVWLPPLPPAFTLTPLLGDPQEDAERGLSSTHWPWNGELKFPAGVVDLPERQEQVPLIMDLTGRQGHLAMVGAPQSGKSTFLRTAMLSSMLTHTPDELQYYCIDMGGGALHGLEDAPHVVGVAGRRDGARVRRVLAEVSRLIGSRERMFKELRVQSAADFRTKRDNGELPEGVRAADVVLVIDNWGALHAEEETAPEMLMDIAARGLGVGVHLWLSANRWAEIRTNLRDNIPGRIELHLNDPTESEINRAAARELGAAIPGRGLCPPSLLHHIALPRADGEDSADDLANAERSLVSRLAAAWHKPAAPALRVLPERVTVRELQAPAELPAGSHWEETEPALAEGEVPIGLRESDLRPVGVDLASADPHFVVFGDSGSGKTAFLRMWMRGLAARHSAREVRFMAVDFRRSLLEAVPPEYIGSQGGDRELVSGQAGALIDVLRERLPPAGVTPRQLRERDWWQGPELYVVADDYDLAAGSGMAPGPLAGLAKFLPQAAELGLHLVLARRVGGAGRALMSDPLLSRLKETGMGGLVLSGDHREGVLFANQRAYDRPPGRGVLVRRKFEPTLVQVALDEEHGEQGPQSEASGRPTSADASGRPRISTVRPQPAQKYL
ncbi:type VII secretion protein EccCa [Streptomyces sp. NPDC054786]